MVDILITQMAPKQARFAVTNPQMQVVDWVEHTLSRTSEILNQRKLYLMANRISNLVKRLGVSIGVAQHEHTIATL